LRPNPSIQFRVARIARNRIDKIIGKLNIAINTDPLSALDAIAESKDNDAAKPKEASMTTPIKIPIS
jgi:hypothetical protein